MYEMAKKGRDALKAKARRMAAGDSMKVDSSDWTPAPLLKADMKTGARPVGGGRLYAKGGKVDGKAPKHRADRPGRATGGATSAKATEIADAVVSRNARKALGTAHLGAFKHGGKTSIPTAKETLSTKDIIGANNIVPKRAATPKPYKAGGRTKKAGAGSVVKGIIDKITGYKSPMQTAKEQYGQVGKSGSARYTESDKTAMKEMVSGKSEMPSPEEAAESAGRTGDKRGGRTGKKTGGGVTLNIINKRETPLPAMGGDMMPPPPPPMPPMGAAPPPPNPALMQMAAGAPPAGPMMPPGRKAGGRITKVASSYKDMEAGAASGEGRLQKTDIAEKHKGAPARKHGGRTGKDFGGTIKNMATSGLLGLGGKLIGDAVKRDDDERDRRSYQMPRKSGGRTYRSYKDMDAGAGSGEGREEKTKIEMFKRTRKA
jgi:hypothetical protein